MLDTQSCQYAWQWEGWHCSKISSFVARYKYDASSHAFPSLNGKIYGTVARVINFILFTPQLALSSIAKIFPTTTPSCSTNKLQIGHSRLPTYVPLRNCSLTHSVTHTYCVLMIPQPVNLVEFHLSKTHIIGLWQLAGHSWKILHSIFCCRLV